MAKLTQKQESFCLAYIELGNKSRAYVAAYDTDNMKAETIHKRANELFNNGAVAGRIAELQAQHVERHNLTIDDLIKELEEARQAALCADTPQSSAAVAATMGKAKLLGLDKQLVEHSGSMGITITAEDYKAAEAAIMKALGDDA